MTTETVAQAATDVGVRRAIVRRSRRIIPLAVAMVAIFAASAAAQTVTATATCGAVTFDWTSFSASGSGNGGLNKPAWEIVFKPASGATLVIQDTTSFAESASSLTIPVPSGNGVATASSSWTPAETRDGKSGSGSTSLTIANCPAPAIAPSTGPAPTTVVTEVTGAAHPVATPSRPGRLALSTRGSAAPTSGGTIRDTAVLRGGSSPTGRITFSLYAASDTTCSKVLRKVSVAVRGDGRYVSPAVTPASGGTYQWVASYSGDRHNRSLSGSCNDPTRRRAAVVGKTVDRVSVAALVHVLAPLPAFAAHTAQPHGIVPPQSPSANIVAYPNYGDCTGAGVCTEGPPCYTSALVAAFTSAACEQEELAAIDNARAKEGVGPMYLPSDYNSLTGEAQLLVVIDLERVGRGLPPFAGTVASLDTVAQGGAHEPGQPAGAFGDPAFPARFTVGPGSVLAYACHPTRAQHVSCAGSGNPGDSISAGSNISALDADYSWMYDDGYGGPNFDCKTPKTAGCWGHRTNILGRYPTETRFISGPWGSKVSSVSRRKALPVLGAGWLQPNGTGGPQGNWTAIFTSVTGNTPALVYTWQQALAAGAGTAPV